MTFKVKLKGFFTKTVMSGICFMKLIFDIFKKKKLFIFKLHHFNIIFRLNENIFFRLMWF